MTDIEQKALALVNEVSDERAIPRWTTFYREENGFVEALCRAVEQHEAFKQEVSDAVEKLIADYSRNFLRERLGHFIIPAPKPDPLDEVMSEFLWSPEATDDLRSALKARGLEITPCK
jgi:hypothetical protein